MKKELEFLSQLSSATSRRKFLKWGGIGIGVVATTSLVACGGGGSDSNDDQPPTSEFDLGGGDIGILNYAYTLEQLEAAFYVRVISTPYSGISSSERALLTDIRDHEVIHRDFLKAALGSNAIGDLSVDFSSIDFASRASVLGAAKAFEDLGVTAYNGAAHLIKNPEYLLLAGKIVSVEARHASAIRDLLSPRSAAFAGDDAVDPLSGLDGANDFGTVLAGAGTYITTPIDTSHLPS